jgi:hypothetical protein
VNPLVLYIQLRTDPARYVVPSLVNVEFHLPFKIDGIAHQVHAGLGKI